MQVIRKITKNGNEIQAAYQIAEKINYDYANEHPSLKPKIEIPEPIYEEFSYSFKLHNLQSYYLEEKENREIDIIATISPEGLVRIKHELIIENQLTLYLSLYA